MEINNPEEKINAIKQFAQAYHELRYAGVDINIDLSSAPITRTLEFIDMEKGDMLGSYTTADFLYGITGQVVDELNLSTTAFPDLDEGGLTVQSQDWDDEKEEPGER